MDKLFIHQLAVPVIVGVLPQERTTHQTILVDLEIPIDIKKAAIKDHIESTIDYSLIRKEIIKFLQSASFYLLESLADALATFVMNAFPVNWIKLSIKKTPNDMPDVEGISVALERHREDTVVAR